jgi:4-hydroxyproline epimerase
VTGGEVQRIGVVDTHTGGEPTRVVFSGGPEIEIGTGSMAERIAVFRDHHDAFRSAVVNEPRCSDVGTILQALEANGISGADDGEIDHIELIGPPTRTGADSKNFVLCPGRAYDRTPCGTGTSVKLACLVADGKLGEGQVWRQESIGSLFEGSVRIAEGRVRPRIRGTAYVNAESTLIIDPADPFAMGIRP